MSDVTALPVVAGDGHRWQLLARIPAQPRASLLWLPALGVAARHYLPLAEALAARGVAVFLHEWRGNGSSSLRPSREVDWGYREILQLDLPASQEQVRAHASLPFVLGGHSLGAQLACCHTGLQAGDIAGLWLVASGTPWWRSFPPPRRWLLPLAYRFLSWLARRQGVLHGRRLGFGGTEARGLIGDWARVGLGNRYAARGLDLDLEQAITRSAAPVTALVFERDWMAPASSMQALLDKMPRAHHHLHRLSAVQLQTAADHFSWMKSPDAVAALLGDSLDRKNSQKD